MRKEFVNVISDKIKDIATPKMLDMKKRIRVPIFSSEQGENLETHISRTADRFEGLKIGTDSYKVKNFKLTLDRGARQWLDDITPPATWYDLSAYSKRDFQPKVD